MQNRVPGEARIQSATSQERLGAQLRAERQKRSLSVRELARRIGLSASLISQVETGRVQPSVTTLMAVVTELGLSLDNLFSGRLQSGEDPAGPTTPSHNKGGVPKGHARAAQGNTRLTSSDNVGPQEPHGLPSAPPPLADGTAWSKSSSTRFAVGGPWTALGVERAGQRAYLELESGVRWERLTPYSVAGMEFLYVTYEVGASSTAHGKHTRHEGIEFGYVTSGTLHVTVGFDEMVLQPGDSIMFDAATPHRLENRGGMPAEAVWLIIGRQSLGTAPPNRTEPRAVR